MPDSRRHRGAHPLDKKRFAPATLPTLRNAVEDLSWLLGRGYSHTAALKIVGDRYALQKRQRSALQRSACSDEALKSRQEKRCSASEIQGRHLAIDGFNCIIGVEAALSGGLILYGRDGVPRDLASVHGSYRQVEETKRALEVFAELISTLRPSAVTWFLDRPVSNSGRLGAAIRELDPSWQVEIVFNPDRALVETSNWIVASSDAWVLDQCSQWFDLTSAAIIRADCDAWSLDLKTS